MKTKHLQKKFIACLYAMLITMMFFLAPSDVRAQAPGVVLGCDNPLTEAPSYHCCVATTWEDKVFGCNGDVAVLDDGRVKVTGSGGAAWAYPATLDTRIVTTIKDMDYYVELRTYVIGQADVADVQLSIIYKRGALKPARWMPIDTPHPPDLDTKWEDWAPTAYLQQYNWVVDGLIPDRAASWAMGISGTSQTGAFPAELIPIKTQKFYRAQQLDIGLIYGEIKFERYANEQDAYVVQGKGEVAHVYTIYLLKENPGVPLDVDDVGFMAPPAETSTKSTTETSMIRAARPGAGNFAIRMSNDVEPNYDGGTWISIPSLFEFRYPSAVITEEPLMANSKKAELPGTFKEAGEHYSPSNGVPRTTVYNDEFPITMKPLSAWGLTYDCKVLGDDIIPGEYGFIYTLSDDIEIIFNTYKDFATSFKVKVGTVEETFYMTDLIDGKSYEVNGEKFYVASSSNMGGTSAISTSLGADEYTKVIDVLSPTEEHHYWSFAKTTYGTAAFMTMGERASFDPGDCDLAGPVLVYATGKEYCELDVTLEVTNYPYYNGKAIPGDQVLYRWYYDDGSGIETMVADFGTDYFLNIGDVSTGGTGTGAGHYRVEVIILHTDATYCEAVGGHSDDTFTVDPCSVDFVITQIADVNPVCSEEFVTVTVRIENPSTWNCDIEVLINGDTGLIWDGATTSTGTYHAGVWELTILANDYAELELTYQAVNAGAIVSTFSHTATINYLAVEMVPSDPPVVIPIDIKADPLTITVVPLPEIAPIVNKTYCVGQAVAPYIFTGNALGAVYSWEQTSTVTMPELPLDGYGILPAFTATTVGKFDFRVTMSHNFEGVTCTADTAFSITVGAVPSLTPILNTAYCYDDANVLVEYDLIRFITPGLTKADIIVEWEVFGGADIGIAAKTGGLYGIDTISFPFGVINDGSVILSTIIKATPVYTVGGGCAGESQYFIISALPNITVNAPADIVVCSQTTVPDIYFNSYAVGASYRWTVLGGDPGRLDAVAIGMIGGASLGYGFDMIPAFTAHNYTTTPKIVEISVYAFMDVFGTNCQSASQTFTITVTPDVIDIEPLDDIIVCAEYIIANDEIQFGSTTASDFLWEASSNAATIGLGALSGVTMQYFPGFTTQNTTPYPIVVEIKVTPRFNNGDYYCLGDPMFFNIVVKPIPAVNAVADIEVCAGATISPIVFTGSVPGTTYIWSSSDNIGIIYGYGNIPSFVAVNTGTTPITATITVTPTFAGDDVITPCMGDDMEFEITVNPIPTMIPITDKAYCYETLETELDLAPYVSAGATAEWEVYGGADIGVAGAGGTLYGTNKILLTGIQNNGATILSTIIKVTPVSDCAGESQFFVIYALPELTINAPADMALCSQTDVPDIYFTGKAVDASYYWEVKVADIDNAVAIGMVGAGTLGYGYGFIPAFTAHNYTDETIEVEITINAFMDVAGTNCPGDTETFTIIVTPNVIDIQPIDDIIVCAEYEIENDEIEFFSTITDAMFLWEASSNAATIGLGALSGTTTQYLPGFTTQNTTPYPIVVEIKVTPVVNNGDYNCHGNPIFFNIVVNPIPMANPVADIEVCAGATISQIVFTGTVPGTTYLWSSSDDIGIIYGYGNIPSFVAVNTGTAPITATITVMPTFEGDVMNPCMGDDITFDIIVNPIPTMIPITNFAYCYDALATPTIDLTGYIAGITTDVTVEWEVYGGADIGAAGAISALYGTDEILFPSGVLNDGSTILSTIIKATPVHISGCAGVSQFFAIHALPALIINAPADMAVCSQTAVPDIYFTGKAVGASYYWEVDDMDNAVAIGMVGAGTMGYGYGFIPAFTAHNYTDETIEVEITVNAFMDVAGTNCIGDTETFTIIVTPDVIDIEPIDDVAVCIGHDFDGEFAFRSTISDAMFLWEASSNAAAIGMGALAGTVNDFLPGFIAQNDTPYPIVVEIKVTPVVNNGDYYCQGNPIFFNITVNPEPVMAAVEDKTYCHGQQVPAFEFTGTTPGATYYWINVGDMLDNLPGSGYGSIPAFLAENTSATSLEAEIRVWASYGDCPEFDFDSFTEIFIITVNPTPVMTPIADITVCAGDPITVLAFESTPTADTYTWRYVEGYNFCSTLGGIEGIDDMDPTAPNTATVITGKYGVKPNGGDHCDGQEIFFNITVNPAPELEPIANQVVCKGEWTAAVDFGATNAPAGTVFTWENSNTAIGLPASGEGNIPSFMVPIAGTATITVTVTFPYGTEGCGASTRIFTITSHERPVITPIPDVTLCAGAYGPAIPFTSNVVGATYTWRYVEGDQVGSPAIPLSGTVFYGYDAIKNIATPVTAKYGVKANGGGHCDSEEIFFNITVNPMPILEPIADQVVCKGEWTAYVDFGATNAPAGTVFTWVNDKPVIGLPATGEGNIPPFVVQAGAGVEATITVTATFPYGTTHTSCVSSTQTFTITGYERPVMTPIADIVVCAGEPNVKPDAFTSTPPATTYTWRYVEGYHFHGGSTLGGTVAAGVAMPGFDAPETATVLTAKYGVKAHGGAHCDSEEIFFNITVNPKPVLQPIANQVVCKGELTTDIDFGATNAPAGTVFTWSNNQPSIGLPGNGEGNIPSFVVQNNVVATITVTATFPYGTIHTSCGTSTQTFTIIGYERPVMKTIADLVVCGGTSHPKLVFTSTPAVPESSYTWRYVEGDDVGFGTNLGGVGYMPAFDAEKTTTVLTAKYAVKANGGAHCDGEEIFFNITVNPMPKLEPIANQIVCKGELTAEIDFGATHAPAGTVFTWSNNQTSIGLPGTGEGNIPPFVVQGANNLMATITVTATFPYGDTSLGCGTSTETFTITSYERPVMTPVLDRTVCAGQAVNVGTFTSNVTDATYAWRYVEGDQVAEPALALTGTGNFPTFTAIEGIATPVSATYAVKANGGAHCDGEEIFFTITVNPAPQMYEVQNQTICVGSMTAPIEFGALNAPAGTVYTWTVTGGASIGFTPTTGSGNIPPFQVTSAGTATFTVTVTFPEGVLICGSTTKTFTITGVTTPVMTSVPNVIACAGQKNVGVSTFVSVPAVSSDDEYVWRFVEGGIVADPALPLTGTGQFPLFNAIDGIATPVSATYAVKADPGAFCDGAEVFFTITVSPNPMMEPVQSQVRCVGEMTAIVSFGALNAPAGTQFTWTNDKPAIGLPASGVGDIESFKVLIPDTARITVTVEYPDGTIACGSDTETFTIIGFEIPTMTPIMDITVCNGDYVDVPTFESTVEKYTTWKWRYEGGAFIGLTELEGIGQFHDFYAINEGATLLSTVYSVTPSSYDHCDGPTIYFTINVNPTPIPDPVADAEYCHGTFVPAHEFTGNTIGASYYWVQTNYIDQPIPELPANGYKNLPAFTALNPGFAPITLEYEVYATYEFNGVVCPAIDGKDGLIPETFTITIYPIMEAVTMPNMTFCDGEQTDAIAFSGTAGGYAWVQVSGDVITTDIDLFFGGQDEIPSFETYNKGNNALVAVIKVTPWGENGACSGESIEFTITVNPTPNVEQVANQVLCAGEPTDHIIFTGNTPGTIYRWTNSATGMGLAATGTGNILSFTTTNTTNDPIVATITVTPEFMEGNPEDACVGEPMTFTITVNPVPVMTPVSNITVCADDKIAVTFASSMTAHVDYNWIVDTNANAEAIGLATSGTGNIAEFDALNTTDNPITVVVTVTPTSYRRVHHGHKVMLCVGEPISFSITVSPKPAPFEIADQVVCVGETTTPINFGASNAPAGTVFYWTVAGDAIGLPEEGEGNIPSFTITAAGEAVVTVTADFTNASANCVSEEPITFTITGYSRPVMTPITDIQVCAGAPVPAPTFGSNVAGATYRWRYVSGDNVGLDELTGEDFFPAFNAIADIATVLTAKYGVIANGGAHCDGPEIFFTITVNPMPEMYEVANQIVCVNDWTAVIDFSALNAPFGTVFEWTNDNVAMGLAATGAGNIPSFAVKEAGVANIHVTATFPDGTMDCGVTFIDFTITGYDRPIMDPIADITVCAGGLVHIPDFGSTPTVLEPSYSWRYVEGDQVGIAELSGIGNIADFNAVTGIATVLSAKYAVKANGGAHCDGEEIFFTITVNPIPTVDQPASQVLCAGERTDDIIFTGNTPGTIYRWTNSDPNIGLAATGTGNILAFTTTNTTGLPQMATIIVTPEYLDGIPAACFGTPQTFYITVNPVPVMDPVSSVIVCNGTNVDIPFTSTGATNVVYNWYVDYNANAAEIGMGSLTSPSPTITFPAVNTTDNPITVEIVVTPSSVDGNDVLCVGESFTFTITVAPVPFVYEIADQVVCVGETTTLINFGALNAPAGTIFYWTNDTPDIGLPATGQGDIAPFEVQVETMATITVTASFPNGSAPCVSSETITFTITGYDRPVMQPVMNITVCAGEDVEVPEFFSTINQDNAVYDWRFVYGTDIGLGELVGQGAHFPIFEAVNYSTTPLTALYAVKVSNLGYCESEEIFFLIQVNPIPEVDPVASQTYCHGDLVPTHIFTGNTVGATYRWEQTNYNDIWPPMQGLERDGYNYLPAFTAINLGSSYGYEPIVLEYEVVPIFEKDGVACEGEPITFTITINPTPEVVPMPNLSFCSEDQTGDISLSGPAEMYYWMQISGDVITNEADLFVGGWVANDGDAVIDGFKVINDGNTALVAVIQVTPWSADGICSGTPIEFTIKVKPTPNVFQEEDRIFCTGVWTPVIPFVGYTEGTIYHWENDTPAIGLIPSGTGNLPSFFTTNPTNEAIVATITVVPEFKGDPYDACVGDTMRFTITVNPIPEVTPTPNLIYCEDTKVDTIFFTGTVVDAEYRWVQVEGSPSISDDVDLWAGGTNYIPEFNTLNAGVDIVYAVIRVTPWTVDGLCSGDPIYFTIAVAPVPVVDKPMPNVLELCAGETFDGFSFTGIASTFTWTMTTEPAGANIGLAESGIDIVMPFTAINNTDAPIVATIIVTPKILQVDDECVGEPETLIITVNPVPVMDPISNKGYCAGTTVETIPFSSSMNANVHYTWYPNDIGNATAIGLPLTATPTLTGIEFTPVNNTESSITVTITVTPWSLDPQTNAALCAGDPITFTITVNPKPAVQPIPSQNVCVGDWTAPVTFGAVNAPAGTIFQWTLDPAGTTGNIGFNETAGSGSFPTFLAAGKGKIKIDVVAIYPDGSVSCSGQGASFTIESYIRPVMTPIEDLTICVSNDVCGWDYTTQPPSLIEIPAFTSSVNDATYTWRYVSGDIIGCVYTWVVDPSDPTQGCWVCSGENLPLNGIGNFPTGFSAVNNGIAPAIATYAVKANGGAHCDGEEIFFTITVNPTPHVDPVANKPYCSNTWVAPYVFTGSVPNANYAWTVLPGSDFIGLVPGSGTESMPHFTTIDNNTDQVLTAYYRVTASYTYNSVVCGGEFQDFSISVFPNATITNLQSAVYCHDGEYVPQFPFEGVATIWRWTQIAGQNIGIASSGEGQYFPGFQPINLGNTPISASFKVVAYYEADGISCQGAEGYFVIDVNPTPFLNTVPSEMVYCAKEVVSAYQFSGSAGAIYYWERTGGDPIGTPNSGTGQFPSFSAVNNTNDILTATFKVWAEYNNYNGEKCPSAVQHFSISILPTATVDINAIPNVFCHNEAVPAIHFQGNIPGTSILNVRYEWIQTGGAYIGALSSGVNTIPAFTATNVGTSPIVAHYKVTPIVEYQGRVCAAAVPYEFTLTVNPKAILTSPYDAGVVCSESDFYYIAKASAEGINFTWVRPAISGINGGEAGSGNGAIINERLINTTNASIVVEYHFSMSGYCTDEDEIFVVKVLVTPTPMMLSDVDAGAICSGDTFEYEILSNDAKMVYSWRRVAQEGINHGASGAGVGSQIRETLSNNSNSELVVQYVVSLYYEDCATQQRDFIVYVTVYQTTQIVGDLDNTTLCVDNDLVLTIDAIGCNDMVYDWYRNGVKIATTTTGVYIKHNAQAADAGDYHVVVFGCCDPEPGKGVSSRIARVTNASVIGQKWDDVLYVDNGDGRYHSYQWYKVVDGVPEPISGATAQYISEELSGTYIVELFDALGKSIGMSCPYTVQAMAATGSISIYPNPVEQDGTLTIVMDMDREKIAGSYIEIYDMVGKQIQTKVVDGQTTNVTMQRMVPGTYVVRITSASGETLKSEKVIVR